MRAKPAPRLNITVRRKRRDMYDKRALDRMLDEYRRRGICYNQTHGRPVVKENGICPICSRLTPVAAKVAISEQSDDDGKSRHAA